jgi:hypothetical protein
MLMQGSMILLQTILPVQQMGMTVGVAFGVKQNLYPAHWPAGSEAVFTVQLMPRDDPAPTVTVVPLEGENAPGGKLAVQPGTEAGVIVQL